MRRVAVMLSLVVASTAGAQQFEGVVTYLGSNKETWQYMAKGNKMRMEANDAKMPGAMILDADAKTWTVVMPTQKMYMTSPANLSSIRSADTARGNITKIGSEVIAGVPCDDYQATDSKGEKQGTICLAHGMGSFLFYTSNSPFMKGLESRVSGLSAAMSGGGFPLKYVKSNGEMTLLATKVEKKSMDASLFIVPSDYKPLQMPPGMQMPQH